MRSQDIAKIFTLFLPIVVLTGMVFVHHWNKNNGVEYVIPITGYDPRDMLRGHYLTFRYDWNWRVKAPQKYSCYKEDCGVCLDSNGDAQTVFNPLVDVRFKDTECPVFLKGHVKYGRFYPGGDKAYSLQRYYIPEKYAEELNDLLRTDEDTRFDIGLRRSGSGKTYIAHLYINGETLEEWIQNQKK